AGVWAFVALNKIPLGPYAAAFAAASGVLALIVLAATRWSGSLRDVLFGFASRHREQVPTIIALEIAYHVCAVVEVYVTLLLISPVRPTIAAAVVLETVNRVITMAFKMLPMRVGVDEMGSSLFAGRVDLNPATGLTLALVRKLRLLFWSAVGLALLARRPFDSVAPGLAQDKSFDSFAQDRPALIPASVARGNRISLALTLALTLVAASVSAAQAPPAIVAGAVSIVGPDGQPLLVPGVTLTLTCGGQSRTEISGEQGEFRFADIAATAQDCSIVADLQGFKSATQPVALKPGDETRVALRLGLETLREEITVSARAPADGADDSARARVERVSAQVMQTAPIASERFQAALPLVPGVVRGPDGLLNINGARSNQSALTFNSADGTDPVTGEDAIEVPIDAVSSVEVRGAAYAPEFGLSAGTVTTVETQKAGDAWHVTLNDLEPRLRWRDGHLKGIESFTPRVTVAGPIVKGTLSLLQSVQYEFSQTRVFGLPPLESDTKLESLASFSRADWTSRPTNHFTGSAMVAPRKTTYAGLNTFNPQSVTPTIENHNVLASAS